MKGSFGNNPRARVLRARAELDDAERELGAHWQPWRERWRRHRAALLIGGGLLGGAAVALLPPRRIARAGALAVHAGSWLAGSALGPVLLGALWTRLFGSRAAAPAETPKRAQ